MGTIFMHQFKKLLNKFSNLPVEMQKSESEVENEIWERYGTQGYVMIIDMSGFTLVTQKHGIVYYLSMIEKMKMVVEPLISDNSGTLVKFVADNVFALFSSIEGAIKTSIEINKRLNDINEKAPKHRDIGVSIGIDYGRFLQTPDGDIFGDTVNCASKLGEDIGQKGDILISKKAYVNIVNQAQYNFTFADFQISGISIETYILNSCHFDKEYKQIK
jgi:adenylate cyclase